MLKYTKKLPTFIDYVVMEFARSLTRLTIKGYRRRLATGKGNTIEVLEQLRDAETSERRLTIMISKLDDELNDNT